jgi:hypothetical protein
MLLSRQPGGAVLQREDRNVDLTTGGPRDNWFPWISVHAVALESDEEEEASEVKQQMASGDGEGDRRLLEPSICTPTLYDQSSGEMNLDSAGVASFVFTDLELATGNVELTYFHKGDDSPAGYYDLLVEEVFTIGTSEPGDAVACDAFTASPMVLNEDRFNTYFAESDSSLTVSMDYDDDFGGNDCANSKAVYFNLKYQEAGCSVASQEPSSDPVPAPTAKPSPMPSSKPSPAEYEQSSDAMTLDSDGSASYVFMNLELAKGNVEVTYYHKGDDSDSYYDLKVANFFSLGESVAGNYVPCEVYTASIEMVTRKSSIMYTYRTRLLCACQ